MNEIRNGWGMNGPPCECGCHRQIPCRNCGHKNDHIRKPGNKSEHRGLPVACTFEYGSSSLVWCPCVEEDRR